MNSSNNKKCINCSSENIKFHKKLNIIYCQDCVFIIGNMNNLTNLKLLVKELHKENIQINYNKTIEALQKTNTQINLLKIK